MTLHRLTAGVLVGIAILQFTLPDQPLFFVALHSIFGWSWVVAAIAGAVAAFLRSREMAVGAVVLLGAWSLEVLPGTLGQSGDSATFRVVSANVYTANPRVPEDLAELTTQDADLLLLQEYSPRWQQAVASGIPALPHRIEAVQSDSFGMAVLGKQRHQARTFQVQGVPWIETQIEVDGVSVRVISAHTLPPISHRYHQVWQQQLADLEQLMAQSQGPTVIAGDLNLTRHSPTFSRLLATGFHTAHAECGKSAHRTWPNTGPANLLRPDHMFLSAEVTCVRLQHTIATGSDHQGVVVDLAVSSDPRT